MRSGDGQTKPWSLTDRLDERPALNLVKKNDDNHNGQNEFRRRAHSRLISTYIRGSSSLTGRVRVKSRRGVGNAEGWDLS